MDGAGALTRTSGYGVRGGDMMRCLRRLHWLPIWQRVLLKIADLSTSVQLADIVVLGRFVYDVCPRYPLHWLPVQHRIQYKIAAITTKTLSTSVPPYNDERLQQQVTTRSVWSTDARPSVCAWTCTETTRCVLCATVTNVWNWLSNDIRNAKSLSCQRSVPNWKTHFLLLRIHDEHTHLRTCTVYIDFWCVINWFYIILL